MPDQPQPSAPTTTHQFDAIYATRSVSPTMARIFREVYGDDVAPAEADAFSFVSRAELERMARELRLRPGQIFVDLGCGAGGPGLWVARATGARVWGIDVSAEAVHQATRRAEQADMGNQAVYQVGEFGAANLPATLFDGALSIDALWLAGDKRAALAEAAQSLKPGGRLVVTTWEVRRPIPGFPPSVADYRPLLEETRFAVEVYEEALDWERRQRGIYSGVLAAQAKLIEEMGAAGRSMVEESMFATGLVDGTDYLAYARRVFFVARRA